MAGWRWGWGCDKLICGSRIIGIIKKRNANDLLISFFFPIANIYTNDSTPSEDRLFMAIIWFDLGCIINEQQLE